MIFVIAGSVSDFDKWLKKFGKTKKEARLITCDEDYRGYSNMEYCYGNNYTHSPLWSNRKFNIYARTHNFRQWSEVTGGGN